jgi:hypothetical protein
MENHPTPEENELSKMLEEHKELHMIVDLIQQKITENPSCITKDIIFITDMYLKRLDEVKIEIMVLIKQNKHVLPPHVTIEDINDVFGCKEISKEKSNRIIESCKLYTS